MCLLSIIVGLHSQYHTERFALLSAVAVDLDYKPPAPSTEDSVIRQFCDGGVCANSPTIIAIAFALVSSPVALQTTFNARLMTLVKLWHFSQHTAWIGSFVGGQHVLLVFPSHTMSSTSIQSSSVCRDFQNQFIFKIPRNFDVLVNVE